MNEEYVDVKASLVEVIAMTQDLVDNHPGVDLGTDAGDAGDADVIDDSVAGALCQYRAENTWHDAVMVAVLSNGKIRIVQVDGDEEVVDVSPEDVRDQVEDINIHEDGERDANAETTQPDDDDDFDIALDESRVPKDKGLNAPREVYRGVPAPKRLKVTSTDGSEFEKKQLPEKLKIRDGDDEKERERKRKQAKTFKGKQRMAEKDAVASTKQSDWQSFQQKVGGKKKTGFMSKKVGTKKGSMFKSKD
jgi:survival-of-motor-neuron-related-splicing factor 30|tara:strand:- start:1656 stop:2399 length:744 start_codon:yes stop_codon:yes gene_type:complete